MTNVSGKKLKIVWSAKDGHYLVLDVAGGHEVARGHDPKELAHAAFLAGAFEVDHRYDLGAVGHEAARALAVKEIK